MCKGIKLLFSMPQTPQSLVYFQAKSGRTLLINGFAQWNFKFCVMDNLQVFSMFRGAV